MFQPATCGHSGVNFSGPQKNHLSSSNEDEDEHEHDN